VHADLQTQLIKDAGFHDHRVAIKFDLPSLIPMILNGDSMVYGEFMVKEANLGKLCV